MKKIFRFIPIIIVVLIVAFIATANILIVATDTTEGGDEAPGVDMAALWSAGGGLQWIYPGNSVNSQGQTLHNIFYDTPEAPYRGAADIMEYTYHTRPSLVISVNNAAAERIFGESIVGDIRNYDWSQGYDRAPAIQAAIQDGNINYLGIVTSLLTGDIVLHIV